MNDTMHGNGHASVGASAVDAAHGLLDPSLAKTPTPPAPEDLEAEAEGKDDGEKVSPMYYILEGTAQAFKTAAQAEKYLNGPDAPKDFQVIRGKPVASSKKVTLR